MYLFQRAQCSRLLITRRVRLYKPMHTSNGSMTISVLGWPGHITPRPFFVAWGENRLHPGWSPAMLSQAAMGGEEDCRVRARSWGRLRLDSLGEPSLFLFRPFSFDFVLFSSVGFRRLSGSRPLVPPNTRCRHRVVRSHEARGNDAGVPLPPLRPMLIRTWTIWAVPCYGESYIPHQCGYWVHTSA